jgi:hypothetical protein
MKAINITALLLLLGLICSSFSEQGKWVIDPQSRLTIHGSTNVNSFQCLQHYLNNDTLEYLTSDESINLRFDHNRLRIPVKGFNCGNNQITKDFQKTLKSETYPHLEILFRSFNHSSIRNNSYIDGVVDICLAGATKRYTIKYFAQIPATGTIFLKGRQAVNFSDFNLNPPNKMLGLIQVQECLEVEFNLTLKAV